jgi:hypothetical protein
MFHLISYFLGYIDICSISPVYFSSVSRCQPFFLTFIISIIFYVSYSGYICKLGIMFVGLYCCCVFFEPGLEYATCLTYVYFIASGAFYFIYSRFIVVICLLLLGV